MNTDPIADLLTRVRNALSKQKANVSVPYSSLKESLVKILRQEGYIESYIVGKDESSMQNMVIKLKYYNDQPVIRHIQRISKPGQRIYTNYKKIPRILGGLGIAIISTSKGLMTDHSARSQKIGGEVVCKIH